MNVDELMAAVTDARVRVMEQNGTYFAVVVEENGDEFELTRGGNVDEMYQELKNMGLAR